jgi:hypothetical protein
MKQTFTLFIILGLGIQLSGLPVSSHVISSSGGSTSGVNPSFARSWDDAVIATSPSGNGAFSQGIHQSDHPATFTGKPDQPDFQVKVFPNPATDYIRIEWDIDKYPEIYAELYDLVGRQVVRKKSDGSLNRIEIDLQPYQRSAYLLKVFTVDGKYSRTHRIVKY